MNEQEAVTTWPEVWARYWQPLGDDVVSTWDAELSDVFGRRGDGSTKVTEEEVSEAIRDLGSSGGFSKFKPKVGDVIVQIKANRKKAHQETEGEGKREGTVRCRYCEDSGLILVRYVVEKRGDKWGMRFPKMIRKTVPHPFTDGVDVSIVTLEFGHTQTFYPCLLCGAGDKHMTDPTGKYGFPSLDYEKVKNLESRYKNWLIMMPDECVYKPDRLRTRPYELKELEKTPAVEPEKQEQNEEVKPDASALAEDVTDMFGNL